MVSEGPRVASATTEADTAACSFRNMTRALDFDLVPHPEGREPREVQLASPDDHPFQRMLHGSQNARPSFGFVPVSCVENPAGPPPHRRRDPFSSCRRAFSSPPTRGFSCFAAFDTLWVEVRSLHPLAADAQVKSSLRRVVVANVALVVRAHVPLVRRRCSCPSLGARPDTSPVPRVEGHGSNEDVSARCAGPYHVNVTFDGSRRSTTRRTIGHPI